MDLRRKKCHFCWRWTHSNPAGSHTPADGFCYSSSPIKVHFHASLLPFSGVHACRFLGHRCGSVQRTKCTHFGLTCVEGGKVLPQHADTTLHPERVCVFACVSARVCVCTSLERHLMKRAGWSWNWSLLRSSHPPQSNWGWRSGQARGITLFANGFSYAHTHARTHTPLHCHIYFLPSCCYQDTSKLRVSTPAALASIFWLKRISLPSHGPIQLHLSVNRCRSDW